RPISSDTLSLHDALPISAPECRSAPVWRVMRPWCLSFLKPVKNMPPDDGGRFGVLCPDGHDSRRVVMCGPARRIGQRAAHHAPRSEEHTSELQSRENLVC